MRVPILLLAPLLGLPGAFAQDAPDTLLPPPAPPASGQAPVPSRLPKPSFDEQKKAEKLVRDLFKDEYAKRTPERRRELAASLLASARGTREDAAGLYVLLREAAEIAASAGDVETALAAVAMMAGRFDVDAAEMKLETLDRARRAVRTPESARALIDAYLAAADEAQAGGDYDGAMALLKKAETAARAVRSEQRTDVQAAIEGLVEAKKQHRELDRLKAALEKDPKDQASLQQLVDLLVIRMDDPAQARQYAPALEDEETRKMIVVASTDAADRTAEDARALGAWYRARAEKETRKTDKLFLFERALAHYRDYLEKDKSSGLKRKSDEQMVAELEEDVDKLRFGNVRDVTRGLLVRWGFDDPRSPGYDTRGKCHAKPTGSGARWVRDPQRGGVMGFDGSGAHLTLPSNPQAGHKAGSWAFWLKLPAAPPGSGYSGQFYVQEASVWIALSHGGVGIDLNSGSGWFDTNGGAALGAIAGKGKITRDQWHHIAFCWDGKAVRCYHNGVRTAEAPTVGPQARHPVARLGPGTTRAMGSRVTGSTTHLKGRIDEFRIYGRALSDQEVMAVVRATQSRRSR